MTADFYLTAAGAVAQVAAAAYVVYSWRKYHREDARRILEVEMRLTRLEIAVYCGDRGVMPTHCDCGAYLMGGLTKHREGCRVKELILEFFPNQ